MPRPGTNRERGYDYAHRQLRREWEPKVQAGKVNCHRCGNRIQPDTPWDLGHDNQRQHTGPEHARCNRIAGARAPRRSWRPTLEPHPGLHPPPRV